MPFDPWNFSSAAIAFVASLLKYISIIRDFIVDIFSPTAKLVPVQASFKSPYSKSKQSKTIECAGLAIGLPGTHELMLAVEVDNKIWPKKALIHLSNDSSWKATIFHDSNSEGEIFAISLWVIKLKSSGRKKITKYFAKHDGPDRGYPSLPGLLKAQRVARVDHLKFSRTPVKPNS